MVQVHIESIGRPILLKGDEVLLDDLVAQVLSDIAPKRSATFSIQICPNPKSQFGPTDISYPEPPSSSRLSHCQNPNNSDPPKWISVPSRWPCQLSIACCNYFGPTKNCNMYHRDGCQLSVALLLHFGPTEMMQSVPPRQGLP